ncbi:HNH endonuclease [Mucilaginibacter terrenus]|uniref:HNH endonuclease n=1 Tax=Mucilaginibacter terrenus TaxID=2482727 RepID=A0A3E2NYF9_9SPHI|nr:HNH endonuclease [Mucilaginibacter terrenus]
MSDDHKKSASSHGSYGSLLFDERWRAKRALIIKRDHNKCVNCQSSDELQVHHRQYHFIKNINQFKPPWDYHSSLLITLCKRCHNKGHNKFKVPNISI